MLVIITRKLLQSERCIVLGVKVSQVFYRWLCVLCFVLATASFLASLNGIRVMNNIAHIDKFVHFGIFALLAALLWKGFKLKPVLAFILLGAYGGSIELAQHFFTRRHGDWYDLLADVSGVISFYIARAVWHSIRPRSRR